MGENRTNDKGLTAKEIAIRYDTSYGVVSTQLKHAGVVFTPTGSRRFEAYAKEWVKRYEGGEPLSSIAAAFDVSDQTVLAYLNQDGVEIRDYSESTRIYPVDESYFESIDADEKAYWLGWLFASGSSYSKDGTHLVVMNVRAEDLDRLDAFSKTISTERPYEKVGEGEVYRLSIKSERLQRQVSGHGLQSGKMKDLSFPSHLQQEFHRPFLLGYVEGRSGTYGNTFTMSGTASFLEVVENILLRELGIRSSLAPEPNPRRLLVRGDEDINTLLDWLYEGMDMSSPSRERQLRERNRKRGVKGK